MIEKNVSLAIYSDRFFKTLFPLHNCASDTLEKINTIIYKKKTID